MFDDTAPGTSVLEALECPRRLLQRLRSVGWTHLALPPRLTKAAGASLTLAELWDRLGIVIDFFVVLWDAFASITANC